jgi:hypothetical protein
MTAIKRPEPTTGSESLGTSAGVRSERALIQWPTGEELEKVSAQLRRISQIGISSEVNGDYFTSGDLAYQLHEIVRTTRELLKRSLRSQRQ